MSTLPFDVFLAYSHKNSRRAQTLVTAINAAKYSVFWDTNIPTGETWDSYIGKTLDASAAVVVLWSKSAVSSDNVLEEASRAKTQGKLLPVRITKCDLPHGFSRLQTLNLVHWKPGSSGKEWQQLLADIAGKISVRKSRRPSNARGRRLRS